MAKEPPVLSHIGNYIIESEIDRGGMGVIYRATDVRSGSPVALKAVLPCSAEEREKRLPALEREAKVGLRLQGHPHIVQTIEYLPEVPCIVMEYMDARTISDWLAQGWRPCPEEAGAILAQIASALDFAHENGIIHRDINSRNVILMAEGIAKVCDFGIAKSLLPSSDLPTDTTATGDVKGTLHHMSPEQLQGGPLDGRTDQFALAVLSHRLLTGEWVFDADNNAALIFQILQKSPEFSPALARSTRAILAKALDKDPRNRFETCREFIQALRRTLRGENTAVEASDPRAGSPTAAGVTTTVVNTRARHCRHKRSPDMP